ncbi:DUF2953 domain-containing protein [Niallia alba]|uniref:DUF2953 domain-containing protein n=1 Tax=Niallia circulans TaxID=1397 RepID=A0A941GNM1_NIACI|nr:MULTISPECIES: DUF2953 domain-containing protein [Niallia]EOR23801.1 hypothetical protein A499_10769 [Niallia nealsonii AAU1]MCB5238387.1 DUF2953 domain-containing protein [Niallia circulans]MDU1844300.1 DUF2953 domain-containing protein [Niallia nealsonii]MED3790881.1 DUF2953 domain-containing protein [Niallia alba]
MKVLFIIAIIIGAFLLLLVLLCFLKLTIHIRYYHKKDNDDLKIEVRALFGLIKYKKTIPLIKIDNDSPTLVMEEETEIKGKKDTTEETKQYSPSDLLNFLSNSKELLNHVVQFHRIVRSFLAKLTIRNIEWSSIVGLGDAAHTGMVSGAIWAVKGSIIGIISNYMKLRDMPKINIYPHFQGVASETLFSCMIQFRIGHAMMAGIKLVKYWKDGFPKFKTNETSIPSKQ